MNNLKSLPIMLILGLIMGFGVLFTAKAVSAQENKPKTTENKKHDDDEDSDEADDANEVNEANEADDDDDAEEAEKTDEQQQELAAKAKITKVSATEIALQHVPGKVVESEIEKEHGKLIWSFDIRKAEGKIFDVEVDAMTGDVLKAAPDDEEDEDGDGGDPANPITGALSSTFNGFKNAASTFLGFVFGK